MGMGMKMGEWGNGQRFKLGEVDTPLDPCPSAVITTCRETRRDRAWNQAQCLAQQQQQQQWWWSRLSCILHLAARVRSKVVGQGPRARVVWGGEVACVSGLRRLAGWLWTLAIPCKVCYTMANCRQERTQGESVLETSTWATVPVRRLINQSDCVPALESTANAVLLDEAGTTTIQELLPAGTSLSNALALWSSLHHPRKPPGASNSANDASFTVTRRRPATIRPPTGSSGR